MKNNSGTTIGVFGHYGNQNLGDEAIIQAVIENCRRLRPAAAIHCFSGNPDDTQVRHGVPSFPIFWSDRNAGQVLKQPTPPVSGQQVTHNHGEPGLLSWIKNRIKLVPLLAPALRSLLTALQVARRIPAEVRFLARSWAAIKEVDLLMISGSNQFLDNFGGAWGFPFTLLKWRILARLAGTRTAYVSVGAGPLEHRLSKAFVRLAIAGSDYLSFRDKGSLQLIRDSGYRGSASVYPDLAFSLAAAPGNSGGQRQRAGNALPRIGINPMPFCDVRYWPDQDPERYRKYIGKFAQFSSALIRSGYPVFFFPTQRMDPLVIDDIIALLDPDVVQGLDRELLVRDCSTVHQLLEVISAADIVIATRFHGVLLSLYSGLPTIAICYGRKTDELMHECGQGDHSHALETFQADAIIENVRRLEHRQSEVAEVLEHKKSDYAQALDQQYREIFSLLD